MLSESLIKIAYEEDNPTSSYNVKIYQHSGGNVSSPPPILIFSEVVDAVGE